MTRLATHLDFLLRSSGYAIPLAIVLTVVLFPWLSAGHASPVILLIPGLCLTPLIYGPALLEPGPDRGARNTAILLSVAVSLISLGLMALIAMAAGAHNPALLFLGLSPVHLLTSSLLLEAVYRLRGRHSLRSGGEAASAGGPANPG